MSVFGSLFTAVSAMTAQSQSLGMISNNIANVNTVGYKRTDAAFSSLVTNESRSTLYSPGSVRANQSARIDQQGILQQSNSATDVAISGNGFFVVRNDADANSTAEPLYTRAGSFSEDAEGVLRNTSGFYLYGWPLDQNGDIPSAAADVSSLVPVNVAFLGGLTQATTATEMSVNLNSAQAQEAYPIAFGTTPHFTRDITVYDSLGAAHNLTVNFTKHESPTATAQGTLDLSTASNTLVGDPLLPGLTAGDSFDITVPNASPAPLTTITITATTTMQTLLADLNAIQDVNGDALLSATLNNAGQLTIKARELNQGFTLAENANTPLADLGLGAVVGPVAAPAVAAGDMLTNTLTTPDIPNPEGWWDVAFTGTDPNGQSFSIESGSINFSGDGQLNASPDSTQTSDVTIPLTGINWLDGSALQDIDFNIANFTQFSGEYNVVSTTQNGAALGLRTGVSIDEDGFVTAQFSNGQSTRIYKLAVATFANANGLDELTGNVFRQSDTSGDYNLREAGLGSAGTIQGGAVETSNVDIADEFSKMIVTQRAYSANTRVISTADQMTEDLLRLR